MKTLRSAGILSFFAISLVFLILSGCSSEPGISSPGSPASPAALDKDGPGHALHASGCLQIDWPGGNGNGGPAGEAGRIAQVNFNVREASDLHPARGKFKYSVLSEDGSQHRQITVRVDGVVIDPDLRKVWFTGVVVADSKGCEGDAGGGHDEGCAGDSGEPCDDSHDTGHDGGCSGTHETGGGCTDSSHVDGGGCSGEDHPEGEGGAGGGMGASGRYCRVGQILVGKGHDGGQSGADPDGITWKWFLPGNSNLPTIESYASWSHLCRKTLIDGGLYVPGSGGEDDGDDEDDSGCEDPEDDDDDHGDGDHDDGQGEHDGCGDH